MRQVGGWSLSAPRVVLGLCLLAGACQSSQDADGDRLRNVACEVTGQYAHCASQAIVTVGDDQREVYWAGPSGQPSGELPAVVLYQGSLAGPSLTWDVEMPLDAPAGGYYQVVLVSALIDAGFVVIQPEASGGLVWSTNTGATYEGSGDDRLVEALLTEIGAGAFGAVDTTQLFAVGISSGGYMTSRMAVSHAGRFRALAIQSASYATCLGPVCTVPSTLPEDHPPTLFLHGTADSTVPIGTARSYFEALQAAGVETGFVEAAGLGHQWLPEAPERVTEWFLRFRSD